MNQTNAPKPAQREPSDSIYELFILALTVFSLLMVAVYFLLPLTEATRQALLWIDVPISLIFLADSFRSLRRAPDKRAYLKWGWLDFLGSIPLILPLRLARLRRLAQAWRNLHTQGLSQVGDDLNRTAPKALLCSWHLWPSSSFPRQPLPFSGSRARWRRPTSSRETTPCGGRS